MKLRYDSLKQLLREVALSPSVFKSHKLILDPMERHNIVKPLRVLEQSFRTALEMNLIVDARDNYDEGTREFDDAAYERIKGVADTATEIMMAQVHKAVKGSWDEAMKGVGDEKPEQKVT